MISAFSQRFDMVYLFHRHKLSVLETLLTQRMLLCIGVTDAFPCSAVTIPCGGVSAIAFVLPVHKFLMLFAVSFVREPAASGVGTGMLWFSWHLRPPFFGHKKSLRGSLPEGSSDSAFR